MHPLRQTALLFILLFALTWALPLHAQNDPASDSASEAQLRTEIARLEAEAARLREELESRRAARPLQPASHASPPASAPATRPSTFATTRPAASLPAFKPSGLHSSSSDASAPASQPAKPPASALKTYSSAQDIFRDLPARLRPGATVEGWDAFRIKEIQAWLDRNAAGCLFDATLPLNRVGFYERPASRGDRSWLVAIRVSGQDFKFGRYVITQQLYGNAFGFAPVQLSAEAELARRVQKIEPGTPIRVTGTIRSVSIRSTSGTTFDASIILSDAECPAIE